MLMSPKGRKVKVTMTQTTEYTQATIEELITTLHAGEQLVVQIPSFKFAPELRPSATQVAGKYDLQAPFIDTESGLYIPRSYSYALGSDVVPDAEAHRDMSSNDTLNVLYTKRGSAIAHFAIIPDELFEVSYGLPQGLEAMSDDFEVITIDVNPDDVLLFFGGVVAHEFRSGENGRLSVMRLYDRQAAE